LGAAGRLGGGWAGRSAAAGGAGVGESWAWACWWPRAARWRSRGFSPSTGAA
jgi:hypothetical protein